MFGIGDDDKRPKPTGPAGSPTGDMRQKQGIGIGTIILAFLAAWLLMNLFLGGGGGGTKIAYNAFREQLRQGNVQSVTVQGDEITGELKEKAQKKVRDETVEYSEFVTYLPSFGDEKLMEMLEEKKVEVNTEPEQETSWLWYGLLSFLPFLLLIGFFYWQFRRMQGKGGTGGIFNVGKSKAKLYDKSTEDTTFDDVAGAAGAKQELQEIVAYLKDPGRIEQLGGEVPTGVLLVGAPGTGKTLLARAVAGEADVPFYMITGSDFMEMFVGVGASRVRNMFEDAKKDAPSIIFIDELDSIGRTRGAGLGGGHDEREQTLNQLLSEMDGFEPNQGVIVMSATNRPDILDPALLRPGRFDRRIMVDMPNKDQRLAIIRIHAREKPLADDVDLERLAKGTPGFSGADIENLLNEAALLAARHEREKITNQDIENARDKVMLGLKRQGLAITDEEKSMIAYHEAGHAVTAAVLPNADPVHKVSIVPRTKAMGATEQLPEKEKYIYRQEYMLDRLAVMMGGRAAEDLIFETSTSGAGNDLQQATKMARKMVLEWGMSDKFRNMALGGEKGEVFLGEELAHRREYSESTAREVDEEVHRILAEAYDRTLKTVREHREQLDKLVEELLEEEEIAGDRVLEILGIEKQEAEADEPEPEETDKESRESGEKESGSEESESENDKSS
jgi:cell division protease FtsH